MNSAANYPTPYPRATILVVGMHRSGTSALSKAIANMGGYSGRTEHLVPADAALNPHGYFERVDIVTAHEGFMHAHDYAWDRVANFDCTALPAQNVQSLTARLMSVCHAIDVPADRTLVIKDPRLCLFLPIWRRVLSRPITVFAVRDPRPVAASLMKAYPRNFTTHFLLALWEKYTLAALRDLRGQSVLFVSYDDLLASPHDACNRLRDGLNTLGVENCISLDAAAACALFDPELNHGEPTSNTELSTSQTKLHAWLLDQAAHPSAISIVDFPNDGRPDPVLEEFEIARAASLRRGFVAGTHHAASGSKNVVPTI